MSGLPLNGELTRRGGRFLRAARTMPSYKLFRLPGGPPFRPGLVKVTEGGEAIDLELWALPSSEVGRFIYGIPHPLGIGAVALEDTEQVRGFICEPIGIIGAEDITRFRGWRAYLQSLDPLIPYSQPIEEANHA